MGLFIENGEKQHPADTVEIKGPPGSIPNFYNTPNGVFFLNGTGAGVPPTDIYLKRRSKATFARQSGPMLVFDGGLKRSSSPDLQIKPKEAVTESARAARFASPSVTIRVSFHDSARFPRRPECSNALLLNEGRGRG